MVFQEVMVIQMMCTAMVLVTELLKVLITACLKLKSMSKLLIKKVIYE